MINIYVLYADGMENGRGYERIFSSLLFFEKKGALECKKRSFYNLARKSRSDITKSLSRPFGAYAHVTVCSHTYTKFCNSARVAKKSIFKYVYVRTFGKCEMSFYVCIMILDVAQIF